jgi:hypothetical protein
MLIFSLGAVDAFASTLEKTPAESPDNTVAPAPVVLRKLRRFCFLIFMLFRPLNQLNANWSLNCVCIIHTLHKQLLMLLAII